MARLRQRRLARRLLRRLPCPVVVVPPDLRLDEIPDGPVGALTDLAPDPLAALPVRRRDRRDRVGRARGRRSVGGSRRLSGAERIVSRARERVSLRR